MGANVRAAVALGANEVSKAQLEETFKSPGRAGEARRIWRGIVIADRWVPSVTFIFMVKSIRESVHPFLDAGVGSLPCNPPFTCVSTNT